MPTTVLESVSFETIVRKQYTLITIRINCEITIRLNSSEARILQWEGLRMTSHLTIRCITIKDGLNFKRDVLN